LSFPHKVLSIPLTQRKILVFTVRFEFDVTLQSWGTSGNEITRFQNNIQSIFNRIRILYGATPLEDIINYNTVVRALTEWTATDQSGTLDQTAIAEGIGGYSFGMDNNSGTKAPGNVNTRQNFIQGIDNSTVTTSASFISGVGSGAVPNTYTSGSIPNQGTSCTRRYQVNLALGLLTQDKLLPVKFMASQLAIEFTLEQPSQCIFSLGGTSTGNTPTYGVTNFNLIPEILEFDSSYGKLLY